MTTTPLIWTDEDEQLYVRALDDVQRFKGVLARPNVTGTWAEKISWQLRAAEWWARFWTRKRTEAGL
jgi:hypothetical protein